MREVFIALGSNVGVREVFLQKARFEINRFARIVAQSSIFETTPLGNSKQLFLNQVIEIDTSFSPRKLFCELKKIEKKLGRITRSKWSKREIDLDIIFFGKKVFWDYDLKIPHAEMAHRHFVLAPLVEIAPNFYHPLLRLSVKTLLKFCPKESLKNINW